MMMMNGWVLVWEKAAQSFQVQDFLLVGQRYIDKYVPWKRGLLRSGFSVFSHH